MKRNKSLVWSLLVPAVLIVTPVFSQDDLYYDPSTDASSKPVYSDSYREDNNVTRQYREDDYYDEDEYAYEYSSRIRRFHQPVRTIDYYDPFFVDMWYYDPFFMPGASIYIGGYNDYWRWRRWNRWNRVNAWAFYDPWGWGNPYNTWGWGWNRPWGWGAWNNPYVFNNYYYDPYWTWNGFNPYYCPGNVWVNSHYYYDNGGGFNNGGGYTPRTYTGPRRGGTTVNPGYARLTSTDKDRATPNRLVANDGKSPVIELPSRPNGRNTTGATRGPEPTGATDRSGVNRPTRSTTEPVRTNDRPARDVTPNRNDRPARDVTPNRNDRPSRDVTPERETRPSRDVTPSRETTPNRDTRPSRETTPNRETRPSREASPSRGGGSIDDRRGDSRPARRAEPSNDRPSRSEPSYDRPSRSNDRSFQPSRSSDGGGSRSSSGSSGSSGSSRSSSGSSGRGGRN